MIEVAALTRRFGNNTAVENVSFDIGDNEIVGLLGHNGAGKTTILRMLCGYLEPSAGRIVIDGKNMHNASRMVQMDLGYLPENLPVYPQMLVADYLEYTATLRGISRHIRLRIVRKTLQDTDLVQHALQPIAELSRGVKQRVGVAQAVLGDPHVLILDEPTNALDPRQAEAMRKLIKRLARRATIIISTHIMQEVDRLCDRVLIMHSGKLVLNQKLDDLRNSKTLSLRTSANVALLNAQLQKISQVSRIEKQAVDKGILHCHIHLAADSEVDIVAKEVAASVVTMGESLYQLHLLHHDLATVFNEFTNNDD